MYLPFDGLNNEWHIIEIARVGNPEAPKSRFLAELELFVERLRKGDALWNVDGVTNVSHIAHIAEVDEDILKQESANLYTSARLVL